MRIGSLLILFILLFSYFFFFSFSSLTLIRYVESYERVNELFEEGRETFRRFLEFRKVWGAEFCGQGCRFLSSRDVDWPDNWKKIWILRNSRDGISTMILKNFKYLKRTLWTWNVGERRPFLKFKKISIFEVKIFGG